MPKIFLSYARDDDEPFVRRLYDDLTERGFDVWFDRVSMPSRQLTFHQEIRDAVADCDRFVLVVGTKAPTSDYVGQEWRFVYFEAEKCINPIVRLDGQTPGDDTLRPLSRMLEACTLLASTGTGGRRTTWYEERVGGASLARCPLASRLPIDLSLSHGHHSPPN